MAVRNRSLQLACICAALAACGGSNTGQATDPAPADSPLREAKPIEVTTSVEPPDISQDPAQIDDNSEDALIDAARVLLAKRLPDTASIELTSFARVVWPDGSLGCPQAGMAYTQALVPGYQVVLSANGRTFHYHGRDGRQPKFCARPQSQGDWQMDR